ncbi:hypothetical protein EDD22DRAFT_917233, partial [Suillus occidentalis]
MINASPCTDAFVLFGGSNSQLVRLLLLLVPLYLPCYLMIESQALNTELKISAACTRFFAQNTSASFVQGWSGYFNIGIRSSFSAMTSLPVPVQIVQSRVVDQAQLEGGCISFKSRISVYCTASPLVPLKPRGRYQARTMRRVRLVGTDREV